MNKLVVVVVLVVLVTGCRIAQWTSKVTAPPFGSVEVTIGGGVIGTPAALEGTNAP